MFPIFHLPMDHCLLMLEAFPAACSLKHKADFSCKDMGFER
ncbi:hypothetical protein ATPR_2985 [Acetobacter tropicalis NBRC 101654]|uniref:Uncharacterized protein n=1 Tax=Acetobacter tropicalis NBRC 101654 TaxID=749388 RepID=F7VHY6_9PROT|nr:hypothetical protein ATPR_2985 [Acetobacter tropicalis NBRC 101654]